MQSAQSPQPPPQEADMAPGSSTRQVTFSGGDGQSIAMARSMVEKIVSERMSALGGGVGGGEGAAAEVVAPRPTS